MGKKNKNKNKANNVPQPKNAQPAKGAASKKAKKNQNQDFKKPKIKPGRVLKKTNVTDTRMTVKKVVLIEQLKDKASAITTNRGLTVDDLCRQLGHYNPNVRRDAIIGVKELISEHPELLAKNLRLIIPSVARLIGEETNDNTTKNQLKNLFEFIFTAPPVVMESHFPLLAVHILRALTHVQVTVRIFALRIIIGLMKKYPTLCLKNSDLFDGFLHLMSNQRRPKDKELVLEAWKSFMCAYSSDSTPKDKDIPTDYVNIANGTSNIDLSIHFGSMDFSVLGPSDQTRDSPLEVEEKLVNCCEVICPLLAQFLSEEDKPESIMPECIHLMQCLTGSIQRFWESNTSDSFRERVTKAVNPLKRLSKNKKLLSCLKEVENLS